MKATRLHEYSNAFELARNQLSFVAGDAGLGKTGDLGIGNRDWGDDFIREESETRTEDDRNAGVERA